MSDTINREQFRAQMYHRCFEVDNDENMQRWDSGCWLRWKLFEEELDKAPSAQQEREDYTEMKREFLRMASYIDSLLVCSDEQKETLMNFISRIAEDMPWTERD